GRIVHDDEYFLSLAKHFPFRPVSWHPRWSGGFIFGLVALAYVVFFGTYFALKPLRMLRAVWGVFAKQPLTRFERYFAYRLWGAEATRRRGGHPAPGGVALAPGEVLQTSGASIDRHERQDRYAAPRREVG